MTATPTSTPLIDSTPYISSLSTLTATPRPVTDSGLTETQLRKAQEYALLLINQARTAGGLNAVTFDTNAAAQNHANDMRANCTFSHWDNDGLKPYMRYTLEGGVGHSAENISGIGFCPSNPDRYLTRSITEEIDQAMEGLLNSPGHLRNIMNPHHRKVNIGIAYRRPNLWLVQLFVGDYIEYTTKPRIVDGVLRISGQVKNGATVSGNALGVQIYYDQPPHSLTRGQLHHTYCYSSGTIIAGLRRPPGRNAYYPTDSFTISGTACGDPYDVPKDASPATSYFDLKPRNTLFYETEAVWITASDWTSIETEFSVTADLTNLLNQHGNGIYTILVWAEINGEDVPIYEYSIFVPSIQPLQAHILENVTPTAITPPTTVPTPTATTAPTEAPEIDIQDLEELTHDLINAQRVTRGLNPLKHVEKIRLIARSHSEDMAAQDYFSHDNLEGLDPSDRALRAGYKCRKDYGSYYTFGLAENIHQGWLFSSYQTLNGKTVPVDWLTAEELAHSAVNGWMNSPGHRQNILDSSYDRAGMGIAISNDMKVYFTQNFC